MVERRAKGRKADKGPRASTGAAQRSDVPIRKPRKLTLAAFVDSQIEIVERLPEQLRARYLRKVVEALAGDIE